MKKRGLVPALGLLYLFGVVIFALILFLVVLPYFQEEIEEHGKAGIACAPLLFGFDVKQACNIANEIQLLLESNKDIDINAFNVKVYGNKDVYETVTDAGITAFAIQKFYSSYDLGSTGKVNKVAIYPILKSGSQMARCSDLTLEIKKMDECTGGCQTCKTRSDVCETASQSGLCEGLDMLYGTGCRDACCSEHALCCR